MGSTNCGHTQGGQTFQNLWRLQGYGQSGIGHQPVATTKTKWFVCYSFRGKEIFQVGLFSSLPQLILDEESTKYVTINTPKGLHSYICLPYGAASAPAIFQKVMDTILQGLPHVICYIDDILVTGLDDKDHLCNLSQVLQHLHQHGVKVKKTKCEFLRSSVEYLGHRIDAEGLHTTASKLKAVSCAPVSRHVHELRSFLGLLNYYEKLFPICPLSCIHWIVCCSKDNSGSGLQTAKKHSNVWRNLWHLPMCCFILTLHFQLGWHQMHRHTELELSLQMYNQTEVKGPSYLHPTLCHRVREIMLELRRKPWPWYMGWRNFTSTYMVTNSHWWQTTTPVKHFRSKAWYPFSGSSSTAAVRCGTVSLLIRHSTQADQGSCKYW